MDYIISEKNKEFLWNILYEKNIFNGIPNENLEKVKNLFESTIINVSQNTNNKEIIEVNKEILKILNTEIQNLKNNLLESKNIKDEFKNEKIKIFDKDLDNKIKSFNNSMNINKPNDIDFLDKLDEPLNNDEMLDKLKQIEKERFNFSVNNDHNNINNVNNENNINNDNFTNKLKINKQMVKFDEENNENNDNLTNQLKINKQIVKIDEEYNIENKINKLDEKLKDIYNILNEILSNQQKLMQNNR